MSDITTTTARLKSGKTTLVAIIPLARVAEDGRFTEGAQFRCYELAQSVGATHYRCMDGERQVASGKARHQTYAEIAGQWGDSGDDRD
jgi:hypothetical protein